MIGESFRLPKKQDVRLRFGAEWTAAMRVMPLKRNGLLSQGRPARKTYIERFESDAGGWLGWAGNTEGAAKLEIKDGAVLSRSPWWIDYNHAPPGAGYLHLLFALHTFHPPDFPEQYLRLGGLNRFVDKGFPRDFTNATVKVRVRGELECRGSQCMLLVQSKVCGKYVNYVLEGQPIEVKPKWFWHTLLLDPNPKLWRALGSCHDRTATYGDAPIADVLKDVNGDIILVLFPLDIVPEPPVHTMHSLRAGDQYPVDRSRLPSGYVMMDEIRIKFRPSELGPDT